MFIKPDFSAAGKVLSRLLSRSEWTRRLLNLPVCIPGSMHKGLILIQIDGLALKQLERAVKNGRMPFIRQRLHKDKTHVCRSLYSGVPSTTPAVQAELFYGLPSFVPAFEFIDRTENRRHVSLNPETADYLAKKLKQTAPPLLAGGHVYSTIFSGGAAQARYCSETMKLDTLLQSLNPLRLFLMLTLHAGKLMRVAAFSLLEFLLALYDLVKGVIRRQDIVRELTFIPARVIVCIILRELIRFRMKMDVRRGAELVCANFLGYDEQAHRRGPGSAFAHWSLKGIDDTIKDIYRTAEKSECLDYDLVIYSDHGQEQTLSYENIHAESVKSAVKKCLADFFPAADSNGQNGDENSANSLYRKIRSLGLGRKKSGNTRAGNVQASGADIQITTMGPLGHVYFPAPLTDRQMGAAALKLVREARIPQVFFLDRNTDVTAANPNGLLPLKRHIPEIIGTDHPCPGSAAADLVRVCRHDNAGDLVISGWRPGRKPVSFNNENGAHGGPGSCETHAFTILPAAFPKPGQGIMRPMMLRTMLMNHLRRLRNSDQSAEKSRGDEPRLTVATYNIHSCLNMDRRCNPDRTAAVLSSLNPDIVALQEVDAGCSRSRYVDQAAHLAGCLGMFYRFCPLVERKTGQYGIAVLSRYPIADSGCRILPATGIGRKAPERRGVMSVLIDTPAGQVRVVNTHLGLKASDRAAQADDIVRHILIPETVDSGRAGRIPVIFCGDLNAGPGSPVYRSIARYVNDIQTTGIRSRAAAKPTFFSWFPVRRIDHIFISSHFHADRVYVPKNHETRMVSDHLPVAAELLLRAGLASSGTKAADIICR